MNTDNITFQAELDAATNIYSGKGDSADTIMEDWPKFDTEDEMMPATVENGSEINVFDYEVHNFDDAHTQPGQEMQEMQEKEGSSFLQ